MIKEEDAPPPVSSVGGVVGGVPGGVPGGQMGGVIGGIISSTPVAVPKVATPQKIRVSSGVAAGNLINRVEPLYPPIAKSARIQGTVVLQAVISKNGNIEGLRAVSGHPMLVPAAIDAVSRWRYKPYLLNGEPVEVETTITVNFRLAG
jgi:protein TonB